MKLPWHWRIALHCINGGVEDKGRVLWREVQNVGNGGTLLKHRLATRNVAVVLVHHIPPRLGAFKVNAVNAHGHPRGTVQPWLMCIPVEREAVDAPAKRPVSKRLHAAGIELPSLCIVGCKSFCCYYA